jgi:type II secretory pathway component PulJ
MGFNTIIDIIGAMFIGGLLLIILFRLNNSATSTLYNSTSELIVQQAMVSVVQVLESDFRKIGYCKDWTKIPDQSKSIIYADSNSIKFLTDINNDGVVDSLYYYVGSTSELSNTPNTRDRLLYRVENKDLPYSSNVGITKFTLNYFDALGNAINESPVALPALISSIQIDVQVENTEAFDSVYTVAFWRQLKMAARNLSNR